MKPQWATLKNDLREKIVRNGINVDDPIYFVIHNCLAAHNGSPLSLLVGSSDFQLAKDKYAVSADFIWDYLVAHPCFDAKIKTWRELIKFLIAKQLEEYSA